MPAPACLRCTAALAPLEELPTLSFWRCAVCNRDYTQKDGELVDRWLSPLSLPLYCVLFSPTPHLESARVADTVRRDRPELVGVLVQEIRDELASPKQRIAGILDRPVEASEEDLREFLRLLADDLDRG